METKVVDDSIEALQRHGYSKSEFIYSRETGGPSFLNELLKTASKKGNGNHGKCDIILYNKKDSVVIIVECKADAKKHNGDDTKDIVDKAVPGVKHYIRHLWNNGERSLGNTYIGIAISGIEPKKITYVGICNSQNIGRDAKVKTLFDDDSLHTYTDVINRLHDFSNIPDVNYIVEEGFTIVSLNSSYLSMIAVNTTMQRYYSEIHKNNIMTEIRNRISNGKCVTLPGVILLVICNNLYYIVDGQHRYTAYKELYQHTNKSFNIFIQIMRVDTIKEVEEVYINHYKAMEASSDEKVVAGTTNMWQYNLAGEVFDLLAKRYNNSRGSIVGSVSVSPYITRHTQIEKLASYLLKNETKYKMWTASQLFKVIEKKNIALGQSPPKVQKSNSKKEYSAKSMKLANECACWLGLVWADEWLQ